MSAAIMVHDHKETEFAVHGDGVAAVSFKDGDNSYVTMFFKNSEEALGVIEDLRHKIVVCTRYRDAFPGELRVEKVEVECA
jgi:hypothetical protein